MNTAIRSLVMLVVLLLAACSGAGNQAAVPPLEPSLAASAAASIVAEASTAPPPSAAASAAPSSDASGRPGSTIGASAASQPTSTLVPTEAPTTQPEPTDEPKIEITATLASSTAPSASASAAPQPSAGGTVEVKPGSNGGAVVSGRGGTIAFTRDASIWSYRPQTGELAVLVEDGRDPRFSPDGTQLAFVRADGVYLAKADGSATRRLAEQEGATAPAWTDDASKLLWELRTDAGPPYRGEIWSLELPSGRPVKLGDGMDAAWAPDGKRVAYVTPWPGDSNAGPRRNELRLVNWQGKNGWTVVDQLPPETPAIGIPGSQLPPAKLEHLMFTPLWTPSADALVVPALVAMQVETDFNILERADPFNGGSTFLSEDRIGPATGSPDRQAAVFVTGSARGDVQLLPRSLDPARSEDYAWAATGNDLAIYDAPAWAPGSDAVAAYRCPLEQFDRCDLVLLAPGLAAPATLVPDVFGGRGIDYSQPAALAWGRN